VDFREIWEIDKTMDQRRVDDILEG